MGGRYSSVPLSAYVAWIDRKSTRLNSSHQIISYAVFCLKKKKTNSPNKVSGLVACIEIKAPYRYSLSSCIKKNDTERILRLVINIKTRTCNKKPHHTTNT